MDEGLESLKKSHMWKLINILKNKKMWLGRSENSSKEY